MKSPGLLSQEPPPEHQKTAVITALSCPPHDEFTDLHAYNWRNVPLMSYNRSDYLLVVCEINTAEIHHPLLFLCLTAMAHLRNNDL